MLFNSLDFALFFPVVFVLYWFVYKDDIKLQNVLLVIASYVFYAWWDYRFLSLIVLSTFVDFFVGKALGKSDCQRVRKGLLWTSILLNIGLLGFFKYYNFFIDNFATAFSFFGYGLNANSLTIILPVGISFYTFQTLSYTIDVYRKKIRPTTDFIAFSAFVSFFPQLVAGPIERASHLLGQFKVKRSFTYATAVDASRQILWGFFKKIVIADNCAVFADQIFSNSAEMHGSTLVIGALFFSFQIYGDFSGYSDIAIGTAKLLGFQLKRNFAYPYFSRDIAEFWRRWHISLSTWFRDYLYIPLGGSRGNTWSKIRNTLVIFIVSGFWHGANWTFIVWGFLNALYFIPLLLAQRNRVNLEIVAVHKSFPSLKELFQILGTFCLCVFAWIFFRAENISHAYQYITDIFSASLFYIPEFQMRLKALIVMGFVVFLFTIEWYGRRHDFPIKYIDRQWSKPLRYAFYYFIVFCILWYGGKEQAFIYFQF